MKWRTMAKATAAMWFVSVWAGWAATTHYVVPPGTPGGKETPPFGAWTNAATNIQAALDAAETGDTILVTNAWYPLEAQLSVTNAVELRSWNDGALDPAGTSLDGQGKRRCVSLNQNQALLAGFTLSNGLSTSYGGAVYLTGGTLSNCIVACNRANERGGGVYVSTVNGVVANCRVEGNVQTNATGTPIEQGGGGIYLLSGGAVRDCTVAFNTVKTASTYSGGGGLFAKTAPTITGCLMVSNQSSSSGGGMFVRYYEATSIRDCTVAWNTGAGGGGATFLSPAIGGTVSECRFIGNNAGAGSGGGVYISVYNFATNGLILSNCVAEYNVAYYGGGGCRLAVAAGNDSTNRPHDFRCYGCSFSSNLVAGSSTNNGGGVHWSGTGLYLESCEIRGNTAHNHAGAYFDLINTHNPFALRNCLVAGNAATGTTVGVGGLRVLPGGWMDNCTVVGNAAENYRIGGLLLASGASATNSIVYHNSAPIHPDWTAQAGAMLSYCCVSTSAPGTCVECLTDDPALANAGGGDYRLTAGSPCADRGTNETWMETADDLDGKPRLDRFSRRVDIGAYERMPAGTLMNIR